MAKTKPIDASELMVQLESDSDWCNKRDDRERLLAERAIFFFEDELALIQELHTVGYQIESVWDFVNNSSHPHLERNFIGPYHRAYPVLIAHLSIPHHERIREGIIRALTVKDGGIELESALLNELNQETNPSLKWVIANALQTAMSYYHRKKHPEIKKALKWTM